MKTTSKITFCALMSALAVSIMLLAYFPYFTYAVPAVAGLAGLVVLIEIGGKWPLFTYIVTAVLSLIFAEPEAKFMYVLLFGYYPVLKAYIERIGSRICQYLIKFAVFNAAIFAVYFITVKILGMPLDDFGSFGKWGLVAFLVLANITFYLYDIVLVRVANVYLQKVHPAIKKAFK
ncbi:MAG: hypothetical protein IJF35_02355 [Clostridia bacterium]|nr:hypothetical protein [Clostridia bacterium]